MKKFIPGLFITFFFLCLQVTHAQEWKTFTWKNYSTSFKVPSDFEVTKSSSEIWSGTNNRITLSIYPRKDENLSYEEMEDYLNEWAESNKVTELGEVISLDEDKLNGYWGVLIEGEYNQFPVGMMLIVDPDYPDISLYIWVSYYDEELDTVLEILQSFTPI